MKRNSNSCPGLLQCMFSSHPFVSYMGQLQLQTYNSVLLCLVLENSTKLKPITNSTGITLGCTQCPCFQKSGRGQLPLHVSDEHTEFGSNNCGWGSLGKAECGMPNILAAGHCTWKWRSSPSQEVFPLSFHSDQQHVKDTACCCKSWKWGGELQVRQRKGVDHYLTYLNLEIEWFHLFLFAICLIEIV